LKLVDNLEESKSTGRKKTAWGIIILLVAFILLAFAYSIINPLHEATDELRHYRFPKAITHLSFMP